MSKQAWGPFKTVRFYFTPLISLPWDDLELEGFLTELEGILPVLEHIFLVLEGGKEVGMRRCKVG